MIALTAALSAQPLSDHIKGLERGSAGIPPRLDSIAPSTCATVHQCDLLAPMDVHAPNWGGTTFDSIRGMEYSSDGLDIVLTKISCGQICWSRPPMPAAITGMANNKHTRQLYTVHTDNYLRVWDIRPGSDCPTVKVGECLLPIPTGQQVATGIEFDQRYTRPHGLGRLFVVTTANILYIVTEPTFAGGCPLECQAPLPPCAGFGTAQGLTYVSGRRELYVTDGKKLLEIHETDCVLRLDKCCDIAGLTNQLSGLAHYQGLVLPPIGVGCADPRCAACKPVIGAGGFPSVSNPEFMLTLDNLQPSGTSAFVLTVAPALTAGIAFGCGTIWLNPAYTWITFPAPHTGGTTGCAGHAQTPLLLPPLAAGYDVLVQAATLCSYGGGYGVDLSAALQIHLGQ